MTASIKTTFSRTHLAPAVPPIKFPFFWVHPKSGSVRRRANAYSTSHTETHEDLLVHVPYPEHTTLRMFEHDNGGMSDGEAWENRVRDGTLVINIHQD